MKQVGFKSENLWLEARLTEPAPPLNKPPLPSAVIAHPHPLFGGSMDNNVVYALRDALIELGYMVLCFNFRGVGKSQGEYSEMMGETEDLISAFQYLKSLDQVDLRKIIICGYSFGGLISLYGLAKGLKPFALILISPMLPETGLKRDPSLNKILPLKIPTLILAGGQDQFFRPHLYEPLLSKDDEKSKLSLIKPADHLWLGFEREIIKEVQQFLQNL